MDAPGKPEEPTTQVGSDKVFSIVLSAIVFLWVGSSRFVADILADDPTRGPELVAWQWPRVIWYGAPWFAGIALGAFLLAVTGKRHLRILAVSLSVLALLISIAAVIWSGIAAQAASVPTTETEHVDMTGFHLDLPAHGTKGVTCCMYSATVYYPRTPAVLQGEIMRLDGYRPGFHGDGWIGDVHITIDGDRYGSQLHMTSP